MAHMVSDQRIIDQLEILDQAKLEAVAASLFYMGAFPLVAGKNTMIQTAGLNLKKMKTHGSGGKGDAFIQGQSTVIEISTREDWETKFQEDLDAHKDTGMKKFAFVTNRDTADLVVQRTPKPISAAEMCQSLTGCGECVVVGQGDLVRALQQYRHVNANYLGLNDDGWLRTAGEFAKELTKPLYRDVDLSLVDEMHDELARQIKFPLPESKEVVLLSHEDRNSLLHALHQWAIRGLAPDGVIVCDYRFFSPPSAPPQMNATLAELTDDFDTFIVVWGADEKEKITDFLSLRTEKTALILVSSVSGKAEVKTAIEQYGFKAKEISLPEAGISNPSQQQIDQHQTQIDSATSAHAQDLKKLEAVIYFLSPLYSTDKEVFLKIAGVMGITPQRLQLLVESLRAADLIDMTGDVLWLKYPPVAKVALEKLIDAGEIDPTRLL